MTRSRKRVLVLGVLAAVAAVVAATAGTARTTAAAGHMTPAVAGVEKAVLEPQPVQGPNGQVLFSCQTQPVTYCYGPDQIRAAYGVQTLLDHRIDGRGRTIVIIDAYGQPTLQSELQTFDSTWGIPDTTLNVIYPDGPPAPTDVENAFGWGVETSLDVEWAHTIAPGATIDLVVARSNDDADILSATKYVVDHNLGDVLSQSYGEGEVCMDPTLVQLQHSLFQRAADRGITLLASSGDSGVAQPGCGPNDPYFLSASTPATDPNVTAVGGTKLVADRTTGAYQTETVWNEPQYTPAASGGGFSVLYTKPRYQNGVVPGNARAVPDVSYNAAIDGGVLTLAHCPVEVCGADGEFWFRVGGTSAGSPQWAGLVALADQLGRGRVGALNPSLYVAGRTPLYRALFHDITVGDNSFTGDPPSGSAPIPGYPATPGWDPATGWGSPRADRVVPAMAVLARLAPHRSDDGSSYHGGRGHGRGHGWMHDH